MTVCRVCQQVTRAFATAMLLQKYDVQYYRCPTCAFVQTETPFWLDEAYDHALGFSDVGGVRRNQVLATITSQLLRFCLGADNRSIGLDYGGGHGLFVRLMRDVGYPFEWADQYAENLYARGFEQSRESDYTIVTAFELFEHLVQPRETLETLLGLSDTILFSTQLLPTPTPKPSEWWYYSLTHGQHVALYSRQTLDYLAQTYQLHLYSNGHSLHLLTRRPLSARRFQLLTRYKIAFAASLLNRRPSLITQDYEHLTGHPLKHQ